MIRTATRDDVVVIRTLWNYAIRETIITFNSVEKTHEEVAEAVSGPPGMFVAEVAGEVVGFAGYGAFRSGVGYAKTKEHSVMLAEGARGLGLGRALVTAVEDHAREAGATVMVAGISAANSGAEAFHAALGYEVSGRLPRVGLKFGTWQDLVLMQKFL